MILLTREQHCLLAGLDIETFKSLKKRGHVPKHDDFETSDGRRGYLPEATLLLMMALEFHHSCGLSREVAAQVAWSCYIVPPTHHRSIFPAIAKTSLRIAAGKPVNDPIMCGLIDRGVGLEAREHDRKFALSLGDDNRVVRFQGVIQDLAKRAPIRRVLLVNISEIAARMRIVAELNAIDLEEYWREG